MKNKFFVACMFALCGLMFFACKDKDNGKGEEEEDNRINPSTIATNNLVAYFAFEADGSDSMGHAVTPKNVSASDFVKGRRGKAYQGKEGSGFIYELLANDKIAKAKGLTFAMWINTPAPVGGSPVLCQLNGIADDYWDMPGCFTLQLQDRAEVEDSLIFKLYQFNSVPAEWKEQWGEFSSSNFPAKNTWFHFVAMYDESTSSYKAYSNGNLVWSEVRYAGPEPTDGSPQPLLGNLSFRDNVDKLYVGAWWKLLEGQPTDDWAQYYVGLLDELRIYDRGLTDAEVKALFDAEVTQLEDE
jgi:hypothetical protein